jgi:hypothetical protein
MTLHAILGLVLLNAFLLVVGTGVLFAVRGWSSWCELARLCGLAYLLGVAASGVVWVLELVVGIPFTLVTILLTGGATVVVGALAGRRLGRTLPARPRAVSLPHLSVVTAIFVAATVVVFEALFRAGRLRGLYEYDAWAFWVPKGKAIYFFQGLDGGFFKTLPGPSYPPLVPALHAASFHFMGSADVVTLHLQFWFLLVGFVAAVAGLLAPRVPSLLLWPFVLLALVSPQVIGRALQPQADLLLDELVAVAALLVALWLIDRETWQLAGATILLAGAMVTKREGFLLAACILVPAFAASVRDVRRAWPRLALVGVLAFLPSVPWRIWFETRSLPSDAPEAGGFGLFDHLGRAWPSLELTVRVLFKYDFWLVVAPIGILALLSALLAGRIALGVYAALVFLLGVAGFTWITWSFPSLPITDTPALNPIIRSVGSLVLISAGLVPLLLGSAWRRDPA